VVVPSTRRYLAAWPARKSFVATWLGPLLEKNVDDGS
jgi:hypothetical protein